MMKVRKRGISISVDPKDSDYCKKTCLKRCECQAKGSTTLECLIWTDDLTALQEEYASDSYNLSVRVAVSDISMTFSILCFYFSLKSQALIHL